MTNITKPDQWLSNPIRMDGEWQGAKHGAGICVIANCMEEPGGGPRLHKHPYAETFVILAGTALFTIGDAKIEASAGHILVVPPDTPHKFENRGPGTLETIDIHERGAFATEWLE
jgi:mannose-6-phosphate isomerase-like protein (cupin superfamily)